MNDVIALVVLILVFVVATVRAINMGALALAAAAVVGVTVFGSSTDDVLDGFPTSLFVILVGVTYLFALARNNGTVDWLIQASIRIVRGRVAWVPWAMFLICALIAGIGAAVPATVAILAPVAMGFASQYRIRRGWRLVLADRDLWGDHQRCGAGERAAQQPDPAVRGEHGRELHHHVDGVRAAGWG